MIFLSMVKSDVKAIYGDLKLSSCLKSIINPSFFAVFLIRLCLFSPNWLNNLYRFFLMLLFSSDVASSAKIGSGFRLPHPIGIVIGGGVVIGNDVTLYQFVTLGSNRGKYPKLKNGVVVYPNSVVVGGNVIGENKKISAHSFVK